MRMSAFARMLTSIRPIMDNIYMDFFFFSVPYRLVWDNWQKFNGEQDDPGDSTSFLIPQFVDEIVNEGTISDHFGLPIDMSLTFNSLHHRAHNLIWNSWFRDQNLQDSLVVDKDNGPDTLSDYTMQKRGKRHDYFSSCLPFAQKGTAVAMPLGTSAPVVFPDTQLPAVSTGSTGPVFSEAGTGTFKLQGKASNDEVIFDSNFSGAADAWWSDSKLEVDLNGLSGVTTDLTGATAATVNQLRESIAIQKILEKDARGGSRYTEILRSHFGVVSPDQRLQRPEYLGGGSTRISVNPVAATAINTANSVDIGDLHSFSTAESRVGFVKSFEEHCLLLGFVNVRSEVTYQQGMPRMFSRQTRYDFYWPSLAHIGEQAVLSQEIFADGTAGDTDVFGYQERWAEYRYKPTDVTGAMRSAAANPLDVWHLALDFASRPLLNSTFIEDAPPIDRVVQVPSEDHFKADFWFDMKVARCMPTNSVPGMMDRF